MYNTDPLAEFTLHAVKVLHLAEAERQDLQDGYLGTEHLLLALLAEKQGLAAKVLNDFGIDLHRVRSYMLFMTTRANSRVADLVSLTLHAQTALDYAASEARRLNDLSIGTGHLLVGLTRVSQCTAVDILASLGSDREYIRRRTLQLLYQMERSYTTNPSSFAQLSKMDNTVQSTRTHSFIPTDQGIARPYAPRRIALASLSV